MRPILCIGNILMKDDGIGIIVGKLLMKRYPDISIHICETDMYYTQEIIDASDKIILIDGIDMGLAPGSSIQIPFDKMKSRYFSQHDFPYYLRNKTGFLFGIQVKDISIGLGLSPILKGNLKKYMDEISKLI